MRRPTTAGLPGHRLGRRRRVGRGALVTLLFGAAWAGPAAELPAQSRSIRFERLSVERGLSQSTVTSILQDGQGFLWLATQDGLNRYDGYGFAVYKTDPGDPATLPVNWVNVLAEDPSGDLWAGTEGGGLARWQRHTDTFRRFRHDAEDPGSLSGDRVRALLVDRDGHLWVGTFEAGLSRLAPGAASFERFRHHPGDPESLSGDRVRSIVEDRRGDLWIGTRSGLNRLDRERRRFVRYRHDPSDPASLSDDGVLSILEDAGGAIWVGTVAGLNRLDPATGKCVRFLADPADPAGLAQDRARILFQDRERRLWIGTDGGLHLWRGATAGFANYRYDRAEPTSLSSDRVASIFQDRGGVLWIGTQGGGVNKWNPSTWSFGHYKEDPAAPHGLSSNAVFAFSEDREGRLWIGTLSGGVNVLERDGGPDARFLHYRHDPADPESLSDDRVGALVHDRRGFAWVGTLGHGLSRFDPESETFRHFVPDPEQPSSLSDAVVTSLYEDRRGNLWVGTFRGGLDRFDPETETFVHHRHDPADPASLSDNQVNAFAEDAAGRLWVGTFNGGLNVLDPAVEGRATFRHLRHDPERPESLSSDTVFALHADAGGTLWVGTRAGLNRLVEGDEEAVFQHFLERDGLPNDSVWGIRSDAGGRLWLSTNNGLSRFDPRNATFKNFKASHGLQANEFNFNAHYASPTGELFFGGVNGFNAFFPDRIESNAHVPPVVLTSFSKINEPVDFGRPVFEVERVELDDRDYFFSLELAALDFAAPEENRYRYKLEGFDSAWVDLGHRRRVTFTNLDPGSYNLLVQGSNNDGVWNEGGLTLSIYIAPPFWQTWWFRSFAALAAAAAVFGAYRLRTRRIRKMNERLQALVWKRTHELEEAQEQLVRKEKLATLGELAGSVAHEIRNPLGVIKNATYLLRLRRGPEDEETEDYLKQIELELERSNTIVGELLDFARQPAARREGFTLQEAVEEALAEIDVPPAIRLERRLDPEPLPVAADRGQVTRILVNLVRNGAQAIPGEGALRVECHRIRGEAFVSVLDTGVGIAADDLPKVFEPLYTNKARGIGLGLALSLRYAQANGGRIECDSELGKGAIFRLVLPVAEENDLSGRSSPSG